jgi:hypothetical protein
MNDKIKKTKDILWELDNKYNQSVPDTQRNINEATEKIVKLFAIPDVVKSLPTKEEINLAANECSDINGIICEDEYWVIAKNDGFKEGADFVINKLK